MLRSRLDFADIFFLLKEKFFRVEASDYFTIIKNDCNSVRPKHP